MIKIIELNKIYNVDCMKAFCEIQDNSINLILTDIPYGKVTQNGEKREKYVGQLRKINKENADIETFNLIDFLNECYRVCKGTIYIFCGIEQVSNVFDYFYKKKDMMTRQCAWKKTNPAPSNGQHMWLSSMENCIFAKKRKTTFNELCKSSVWESPTGRSKIHPTEKPLSLFEYLLKTSSNEGDIVFDPCIGSGTTAIAAINNNRNYIGFEINNTYYKLANDRILNCVKHCDKEA